MTPDEQPPLFSLCPGNIYAFEDETPEWSYPMFDDNVAVVYVSDPPFEARLAAGNYTKRFHIYDYEDNAAICFFQVIVSSRGTYFIFSTKENINRLQVQSVTGS